MQWPVHVVNVLQRPHPTSCVASSTPQTSSVKSWLCLDTCVLLKVCKCLFLDADVILHGVHEGSLGGFCKLGINKFVLRRVTDAVWFLPYIPPRPPFFPFSLNGLELPAISCVHSQNSEKNCIVGDTDKMLGTNLAIMMSKCPISW